MTIETVDVGWCKEITDQGATLIAQSSKSLRYLGLMRCDKVRVAYQVSFLHITVVNSLILYSSSLPIYMFVYTHVHIPLHCKLPGFLNLSEMIFEFLCLKMNFVLMHRKRKQSYTRSA